MDAFFVLHGVVHVEGFLSLGRVRLGMREGIACMEGGIGR